MIKDLKSQGHKIISIDNGDIKVTNKLIKTKKLKEKMLSAFLQQFSILLSAGIDIKSSINILYEQEIKTELGNGLKIVIDSLNNGFSLSESMENSGIFSSLIINIIKAGESTSKLPDALNLLSKHYQEEIRIKQSIKNSLYYPIILLVVTFIIVILIITFVLPRFIQVFSLYGDDNLPWLTMSLLSIANYISNNYILLIISSIIAIVLIVRIMKSSEFKYYYSKQLLKLPIIGKYVINVEIQRFSSIFSLSNKSGLDTITGLKIASNAINNIYLKEKFNLILPKITMGSTLYESIKPIKYIPKMFVHLINVGETASSLSETMEISYNYFKNNNENESKKLISIFEPLIIIFVSLIVGTVVLAIALPTFNIVNIF